MGELGFRVYVGLIKEPEILDWPNAGLQAQKEDLQKLPLIRVSEGMEHWL